MPSELSEVRSLRKKLGSDHKLQKVRFNHILPNLTYIIYLSVGLVYPNKRKKWPPGKIISMLKAYHTTPNKVLVLNWEHGFSGEDNTMGRLHIRPIQWYLKTHWRYPQSLDIPVSVSQVLKDHLQWWTNHKRQGDSN